MFNAIASIFTLPDCGHSPHHQARETVLAAAGRFVGEVCAKLSLIPPPPLNPG